MKKLIGLIAVAAMAATFAGCNSADRASTQGKEVKVAGEACAEGKTGACCSGEKAEMAKSSGGCTDKAASCSDKSATCTDKTTPAKTN